MTYPRITDQTSNVWSTDLPGDCMVAKWSDGWSAMSMTHHMTSPTFPTQREALQWIVDWMKAEGHTT